jgi:hypothetical protein
VLPIVREYWLVHPTGRVLKAHLLGNDGYSKPHALELTVSARRGILPDIEITWDELLARLPLVER